MMPSTHRFPVILAILFSLIFPTLLTATYFVWLQGTAWVQIVYAIGKGIQFLFPCCFIYWYYPARLNLVRPPVKTVDNSLPTIPADSAPTPQGWFNLGLGVIFGLAVVVTMIVCYRYLLPPAIVTSLQAGAQEKVAGMGIDNIAKYLAVMGFYVLFHSLLEEYYWRWFNYSLLKELIPSGFAKTISSLGFMSHHVILVAAFVGLDNPFVWLLSASVAVGGWFWCWQLDRPWGFRSAWLSHAIVDAGIFGLGLWIVTNAQPTI